MFDIDPYMAPGGRIFVDTCSLMHRRAPRFFLDNLAPRLKETGAKVIVPMGVVKELRKFNQEDSRRGKLARDGYRVLCEYQRQGLLELRGEEDDRFPDQLFLSLFVRFMTHYDLCLITQDRKLAKDLSALEFVASVEGKRSMGLFGISSDGERLISHGNRGFYGQTPVQQEDRPFAIGTAPVIFAPIGEMVESFQSGDVVYSGGLPLTLTELLGQGGEGACWLTDSDQVCKIYRPDRLSPALEDKLALMVEAGCSTSGICWPRELVRDGKGRFIGYLMDRAQGRSLHSVLSVRANMERLFPHWTRKNLVSLAIEAVERIGAMHRRNVLLGDINTQNILLSQDEKLWFVDVDSYQVENYPCPVGTVTFTAPEIQGRDFKSFLRTEEQEQFALATLIFMILLPGKPPYSHQGGGNPGENIKLGNFPYAVGEKRGENVPRGPWRNIFSNLPRAIKDGFEAVFNRGDRIPAYRWLELLKDYSENLDKGYVSDEIFPKGLKLVDPVERICPGCGERFQISSSVADSLEEKGKDCYCDECRKDVLVECDRCKERFPMPQFLVENLTSRRRPIYCDTCREPVTLRCVSCGHTYETPKFKADEVQKGFIPAACPDCREVSRSFVEASGYGRRL